MEQEKIFLETNFDPSDYHIKNDIRELLYTFHQENTDICNIEIIEILPDKVIEIKYKPVHISVPSANSISFEYLTLFLKSKTIKTS